MFALGVGLLLSACATDPTLDAARGLAQPLEGPQAYASIVRVADATAQAGDCATAVGLYRRATETWPADADVRAKLGTCLANLGAYNEAIAAFQTAISLNSNHLEARRGLGNVYVALDRPELALPQLEGALLLDPNDPRTYNSYGVVLDMQGDHRGAQSKYRTGLALDRGNISLINNLGLSLALSGDFEEAIMLLKPVAAHPDAGAKTRQNLALIYGLAGDPEQAARMARIDLDEVSVRRNLAYYSTLRALKDRARTSAIGATGSREAQPALAPAR
ncbi:MAG: tetratricopeptide repeat protein [Alphaproteobacteria bacterium]|nr:tetratricopeptide repeat protein [Alphaproteobacteria bacterium]